MLEINFLVLELLHLPELLQVKFLFLCLLIIRGWRINLQSWHPLWSSYSLVNIKMWCQPNNQGSIVYVVLLIIQQMHVQHSRKQNKLLMFLPCNLDNYTDLNNNNIILSPTLIILVGDIIWNWGMVLVHNNSHSDNNNFNPPPANAKLLLLDNNNCNTLKYY